MTPALWTLAGFVWAGLATVAALAAAVARWRSSSDETTATLWKDEAAAWKAKAERLEKALEDLTKRVEHIEQENTVLRTLNSNTGEIVALRVTMNEGFASILSAIAKGEKA